MKSTIVKTKDKDLIGSLRGLLGQMLETELVQALLVPRLLPGKDGFVQSLVTDPEMLKDANPLAPTMPVQSAQILSDLTSSPFKGRIGAVVKPCELRAVVELSKFLQIDLENIMTIGVDCLGTYEARDYSAMVENDSNLPFQIDLQGVKDGKVKTNQDSKLRESCQICETPGPTGADLTFGIFGHEPQEEFTLLAGERFEKELEQKLSLELEENNLADRDKAVQKVVTIRKAEREKVFNQLANQTNGLDKLMEVLSTCIRCHNCMNVCPICYCKECVFESSVFEHRSDQFLSWAGRKGAIRMPTDTLIFHLTRMSHMATSCVSCGMCDSGCPSQLPVSRLFGLIGAELQKTFEYVPGMDPDAEPPVSVFKEEELQAESGTE